MRPRRILLLLAAALALGLHLTPRGARRPGGRVVPPAVWSVPPARIPAPAPPKVVEDFLGPGDGVVSVHVASLAEVTPGVLAAAWYGGSREGARDVAILLSLRDGNAASGWTRPRPIVTAASAEQELGRHVRKVGNPLIYSDGRGRLELLFVTIAVGGWSGSSLNLKSSADGGITWSPATRLVLSPLLNISELVKNPPVPLEDGGWAVPIYHEFLGKFPEILWLDVPGAPARATRTRPFGGRTAFQPALAAASEAEAVLLCRTAGERTELFRSHTADGGLTWSPPEPGGVPNPGSGIAAIRLTDGRLLLAFNDAPSGRDNLRLAVSADGGHTWRRGATGASEPGAEFSYPFLLQASDDTIHLVFTWKRERIRHLAFNSAWLDASLGESSK